MKRLNNCPGCGAAFTERQYNEHWFAQTCANRCQMCYSQNMAYSHDDEEVSYISFSTKHFHVYVYYNNDVYGIPREAHIYSEVELKKHGKASIILKLPVEKIDVFKAEDLDAKLQTLVVFA